MTEFPPVVNRLRNALRCLIRVVALACEQRGVGGRHLSAQSILKLRRLFNRVRSSQRRKKQP